MCLNKLLSFSVLESYYRKSTYSLLSRFQHAIVKLSLRTTWIEWQLHNEEVEQAECPEEEVGINSVLSTDKIRCSSGL